MKDGSTFERFLQLLSAEERVRAYRLRDALRLREDDAVWEFGALAKAVDHALKEIPTKCSQAAEHVALSEFTPSSSSPVARVERREGEGRPRWVLALVSLFVAADVLIGATAFTLGSILTTRWAPWVPARVAPRGAIAYVLTAIWTAPIGGLCALQALAVLSASVVAVRLWRRVARG